jgi:hypothetical protein
MLEDFGVTTLRFQCELTHSYFPFQMLALSSSKRTPGVSSKGLGISPAIGTSFTRMGTEDGMTYLNKCHGWVD